MSKQKPISSATKLVYLLTAILCLLVFVFLWIAGLLPVSFLTLPEATPSPGAQHAASTEAIKVPKTAQSPNETPVRPILPSTMQPPAISPSSVPIILRKPQESLSWEEIMERKLINYSSDAALLTATDAEGQIIEPDRRLGYLADQNRVEQRGHQEYRNLKYQPTLMTMRGERPGDYSIEMILKGRMGLYVEGIRTDAGIVDTVRHDGDIISITFDARHPREDTFIFSFGGDSIWKSFRVRHLPVIPGATLTLTMDWQALREDKAPLTIAVDANGDGEAERSLKVGGEPVKGEGLRQLNLTPETPEYSKLFGEEGARPDKE